MEFHQENDRTNKPGDPVHLEELGNEEKNGYPTNVELVDEIISKSNGALLLDVGTQGSQKPAMLASDGHTVLIPQPSADPNDPVNWSSWKKHSILLTLAIAGFMADFQATSGIPCLIPQAAEWGLTPTHVNYSGNLNIIMAGIGGVLGIPFLYCWGRAPVAFWSVFVSTVLQIGCARAQSFDTFYAMRALVGLTCQPALTAGLSFIQDMFFFHEHARKIGLWAAVFLIAPYGGPLFGNFIVGQTGNWRYVQWLPFAVGGANILMMIAFLDETWYRRDIPRADQPERGNRVLRLLGYWQIREHRRYFDSFWKSCMRVLLVIIKPTVLLVFVYYMAVFMWLVGINQTSAILFATPRSEGGYGFDQNSVGFLFFAPIVGILTGELFGHFFHDFVLRIGLRRHKGVFLPEQRLPTIYIGLVFMLPGLILIGQALQHHWIWVAIAFAWAMFAFGTMLSSVAITAYALGSYPTASGEVSSLINLARVLGGFSVGYFQLDWGLKSGWDVSFGCQAAVVGAATLGIIPILQLFGAKLRRRGGELPY